MSNYAITKEELIDWNSHPVTKAIFRDIKRGLADLNKESVVKDTADQTAMQASYNQGIIYGVGQLLEAYEELEDALLEDEDNA